MITELPNWSRSPLPTGVVRIPGDECASLESQFLARTLLVQTPRTEPGQSRIDLLRPSASYFGCSLPDGVLCFVELYPELARALEKQVNLLARDGVRVWPIGNFQFGGFQGHFTLPFREWLQRDFLLSPLAVMSVDTHVLMIFDEQMHYGLLGVERRFSTQFFEQLGGVSKLNAIMNDYVEQFGVGFGEPDRRWAKSYLG